MSLRQWRHDSYDGRRGTIRVRFALARAVQFALDQSGGQNILRHQRAQTKALIAINLANVNCRFNNGAQLARERVVGLEPPTPPTDRYQHAPTQRFRGARLRLGWQVEPTEGSRTHSFLHAAK